MCELSLNDVRYEMIDPDRKFFNLLINNQLHQLHTKEDVPLLSSIFTFLCILSRVNYIKFLDVENLLLKNIFIKLEENNALEILETINIILLEHIRRNSIGIEKTKELSFATNFIKEFLCREFEFLINNQSAAVAHVWIVLINAAKVSGDEEW